MIRMSFALALLASLLAAPNAFAQANPPHDAWCLQTGSGGKNCVYATLKQCQAAKHGTSQHCIRNR
jgi:hypothetical protein